MEILIVPTIAIVFVALLLGAAFDVRTGEVPNRVWIPALITIPLPLLRLYASGFLLLFAAQVLAMFGIVIISFHLGLLGGADGKAILILSLTSPWLEINAITLLLGSGLVIIGAFIITGIHCLILTLWNLYDWYQYSSSQGILFPPEKTRYWFTRRISEISQNTGSPKWKRVSVPLMLYILITYLVLLVCNGLGFV